MYIVPFDSETLRQIISGEIESPVVNYNDSKLKGKNLITYFSNLKYKGMTLDMSNVPVEDKLSLVEEYIKHQSTVKLDQIEATVIKCLFYGRGYNLDLVDKSELDVEILSKGILSNDEVKIFVDQNKELVTELLQILDGVLLYAIKNLNQYKEELGDHITDNVVTDKGLVGKTFVNLFSNETFNCHYYADIPNFSSIKYFDHYYDRPIYSGKTLLSYITGECVIFPMLKMILNETFTPEQLNQLQEEANAASV